jgi:hypothetical protein
MTAYAEIPSSHEDAYNKFRSIFRRFFASKRYVRTHTPRTAKVSKEAYSERIKGQNVRKAPVATIPAALSG